MTGRRFVNIFFYKGESNLTDGFEAEKILPKPAASI